MPEAKARAFAACLEANPRFSGATVHQTRPGGPNFYVAFLPTRPESQEEIFLAYQREQIERATREMDGYQWCQLDGARWRVTTLPHPKTGVRDIYVVHATALTCSCPHFTFRLAPTGCLCKHLVALFASQPDIIPLDASQVKPVAALPDWGNEIDDLIGGPAR